MTDYFASNQGYAGLDFRYETMCVAFLLRRRIFDEDFLPQDSEIAKKVKMKCTEVLDGIANGSIQVLGGAVDLEFVMKQVIEYVDRKGRGAFMWAV